MTFPYSVYYQFIKVKCLHVLKITKIYQAYRRDANFDFLIYVFKPFINVSLCFKKLFCFLDRDTIYRVMLHMNCLCLRNKYLEIIGAGSRMVTQQIKHFKCKFKNSLKLSCIFFSSKMYKNEICIKN